MRQIASYYLHNVGFEYIWFDNNCFNLLGVKSGVPEHTLCSAGNGSGKSTSIALLMSTLYPDRKKFLRTQKDTEFKFEDYFDDFYHRPGFVVIEFDAGQQLGLVRTQERVVVGQVVCLPQAKESEMFRKFFSFRANDVLNMKSLIAGVAEVSRPLREINSLSDIKEWFIAMQAFSPQNANTAEFFSTDHQERWTRRLQDALGIDQELVQLLWRFNKKEGGGEVKDATSFHSDHDFLRKFLYLCLNEEMSDALKVAIEKDLKELTKLPVYEETLQIFVEMGKRFDPFRQSAAGLQAAKRDHAAEVALAMGLSEAIKRARSRHEQAMSDHEANRVAEQSEADRAEQDILDAQARKRGLELFLKEVKVRMLEKEYDSALSRLEQARDSLRKMKARRALNSLDDKLFELHGVEKDLAAIQAEVEDFARSAREAGGLYKAALDHEIAIFSGRRDRAQKVVAGLGTAKDALDRRLKKNASQKGSHEKEQARLEAAQAAAAQARFRLESEKIVLEGESGREALERIGNHVAEAQAAKERAAKTKGDVMKELTDLNRILREKSAEHGRDKQTLAISQKRITEAEAKASRLVTELHAAGLVDTAEADVESSLITRKIDELQEKLSERLGISAIERKALENDETCIATYGVLGVDHNVATVVGRCKQQGIQAKPYGAYLAGIFAQNAESAGGIYLSDPARFAGVQVNDAESLMAAGTITGLALDRPVVVSLPTDRPQDRAGGNDILVLPPAGHSLYNTEAATEYAEKIKDRLEEIDGREVTMRARQRLIAALATRHAQYLDEFGTGKLDGLRNDAREQTTCLAMLTEQIEKLQAKQNELDVRLNESGLDETRKLHIFNEILSKQRRVKEFVQDHEAKSLEVERSLQATFEEIKRLDVVEKRLGVIKKRTEKTWEDWTRRNSDLAAMIKPLQKQLGEIMYCQEMSYNGNSSTAIEQVYRDRVQLLEAKQNGKALDLSKTLKTLNSTVIEMKGKYSEGFGDLDEREIRDIPYEGIDLAIKMAQEQVEDRERSLGEKSTARDMAKGELQNQSHRFKEEGIEVIAPSLPDDIASGYIEMRIKEVMEDESVAISCRNEAQRRSDNSKVLAEKEKVKAEMYSKAHDMIQMVVAKESGDAVVVDEPSAEEAAEMAMRIVSQIQHFNNQIVKMDRATINAYQAFIPFLNEEKVRSLAAVHCESMLRTSQDNAFECFVADAEEKARLINDKIRMLEYSISEYDDKLSRCSDALTGGVEQGLRLLRRATSVEVPLEVPVLGGQPILKISRLDKLCSKGAQTVPMAEVLKRFIKDLVAQRGGSLPTGQALIADALHFVAKERLTSFKVCILKAIPAVEQFKHVPIENYSSASGGEGLTSALMYYLLAANIRSQERGHSVRCGGALILDNPLGEVNLPVLIKTQRELASSLGVQLIYFTGIMDLDSTSEFRHNVAMRVSKRRDVHTGRRFAEVWWGETLKEAFGETG